MCWRATTYLGGVSFSCQTIVMFRSLIPCHSFVCHQENWCWLPLIVPTSYSTKVADSTGNRSDQIIRIFHICGIRTNQRKQISVPSIHHKNSSTIDWVTSEWQSTITCVYHGIIKPLSRLISTTSHHPPSSLLTALGYHTWTSVQVDWRNQSWLTLSQVDSNIRVRVLKCPCSTTSGRWTRPNEACVNPILPLEANIGSESTTSHPSLASQRRLRQWQRYLCVRAWGKVQRTSTRTGVILKPHALKVTIRNMIPKKKPDVLDYPSKLSRERHQR